MILGLVVCDIAGRKKQLKKRKINNSALNSHFFAGQGIVRAMAVSFCLALGVQVLEIKQPNTAGTSFMVNGFL